MAMMMILILTLITTIMSELTYKDLREYIRTEITGREPGTYTSLGGVATVKIEDTDADWLVTYRYSSLSWQFTYSYTEVKAKQYA